jgi:hypothetical protein
MAEPVALYPAKKGVTAPYCLTEVIKAPRS